MGWYARKNAQIMARRADSQSSTAHRRTGRQAPHHLRAAGMTEDPGYPPRIVYTPREVAAMLGVSRTTVYRWISEGTIPTVQMGDRGQVLIPKRPFLAMFGEEI